MYRLEIILNKMYVNLMPIYFTTFFKQIWVHKLSPLSYYNHSLSSRLINNAEQIIKQNYMIVNYCLQNSGRYMDNYFVYNFVHNQFIHIFLIHVCTRKFNFYDCEHPSNICSINNIFLIIS